MTMDGKGIWSIATQPYVRQWRPDARLPSPLPDLTSHPHRLPPARMHIITQPQHPISAPSPARPRTPHVSVVPLPSPRTIQIQHTRAVRQGASWTAAYHRHLTVAVVARPVRGSAGALGVLAAERSWWLLAQTTSARRSVQPVSRGSGVVAVVDIASSHATASVAGVQQALSTHPGSASGIRLSSRPVSGHLGSSSRGSGGRPSAVHPFRCPAVCCPPVRCPAVWCLPRRSGASVSSHSGGGVGDPGRGGRYASDAAEVGLVSGRSLADPGRWVGWGPRRPRLPTERPGRPGRRAERPSRAAARWAREQAAARGGCIRGVATVLGLGARPRCVVVAEPDARVGGPGGARDVPAGMGLRPQCGPSRQRVLLARGRQRSDLRRWVVGLPGLEPGTSSLSAIFK
jgi:hypothetical protein